MNVFNKKKVQLYSIYFNLFSFKPEKKVPAISNFISFYFTRNYDVPDGIN